MAKSEAEKNRLKEKIRNAESLIQQLERKSDDASKRELARQRQERDNLQYELDKG
jgi:hypothetical protein